MRNQYFPYIQATIKVIEGKITFTTEVNKQKTKYPGIKKTHPRPM